ncbi:hypothetical protein [Sphaerisporangium fuscum]|uniref:hypothetical protein n=1 Tax=Sphaerisporangium fuscum TaxID=2835868 RepID=UPI001BDD143A|nr:hypothetical protein [Sphaerisporangium fuscum]
MTTTTIVYARMMIEQAARGQYRTVYTPSALEAASTVLAEVHAAAERHGVAPADWTGVYGADQRLAEAVLVAQSTAYRRASLVDLRDPRALLAEAAARSGLETADERPGRAPLEERSGFPMREGMPGGDASPHRVTIRLARLPETPPWGWDGLAPLVVALDRFESLESPAWKWELYPDVGEPSTQMVQVVAPPPSAAVADEVLAVARRILTGTLRLYL